MPRDPDNYIEKKSKNFKLDNNIVLMYNGIDDLVKEWYNQVMKICTKCKVKKEAFPKRSASKDGLSSWCTECFTEHSRNKYRASKEERSRKQRNQDGLIGRARKYIYEYLLAHPCIVCGEDDIVVLEFDHRDPKEKDRNVSEMMRSGVQKVAKEIDKCDVMCANCHRRKTIKQFGTWKNYYGV